MESKSYVLAVLSLAALSCHANHTTADAGMATTVTEHAAESPHTRAAAPDAEGNLPKANDEEGFPLTNARIDAEIRGAGTSVLFDEQADLNGDRIPDRLVILEDLAKGVGRGTDTATAGRRLLLYRGGAAGRYAVWAVTDKAIPPYRSNHMVGEETGIQDIRAGDGVFSFAWVNETYFIYRYRFVYEADLQTLKLSEIVVEQERAERFPQEEVFDLHLTVKNFGHQPIEFFDAQKFQDFTDAKVRKRLKLH